MAEERQGKPQLWQKPLEQLSKGMQRLGQQLAQPWGTHGCGRAWKPPGSLGFRPLWGSWGGGGGAVVVARWRRCGGDGAVATRITLA